MQPDAQNKALLPELAPKRATAAEFYLTLRRTTCFSNCSPVSSITLNGSLTVIYPSGNLCPATIFAVHFSSVAESCPTLCDSMIDCSPLGFSVHGILQAKILECVAIWSLEITCYSKQQLKPNKKNLSNGEKNVK